MFKLTGASEVWPSSALGGCVRGVGDQTFCKRLCMCNPCDQNTAAHASSDCTAGAKVVQRGRGVFSVLFPCTDGGIDVAALLLTRCVGLVGICSAVSRQ